MSRFSYIAVERSTGRERKGFTDAPDRQIAASELKARGLAPVSILAVGSPPAEQKVAWVSSGKKHSFIIGRMLSSKALALFTRQLAVLLKARMPLLRSLEVLSRQERNRLFKNVMLDLAESVRSGKTLSDGMRRHPKAFEPVYVNMVRAGEASGAVADVLSRQATFMEKSLRLRGRVRSAMTYPAVISVVAIIIVAVLMTVVVPKFEGIFATMLKGQPLPVLTQMVLSVSRFLQGNLVAVALGLSAVIVGWYAMIKTPWGAMARDRWILRLPVFGTLLLKTLVARFARTLGTLLTSGVPVLEALTITREAIGNRHAAAALQVVHDRVKAGEGIAAPLAATGVFPSMLTSMIDVGEETSAVPDMLTRVADIYEDEVDQSVSALTALIEPAMIVLMAVLVGTVVIALFLPIVRIVQLLGV